jgi:hypothetical protein
MATNNGCGLADKIYGIINAKDYIQAKSIAEMARDNIFLYKVGISQSVGDVKVAIAINKYIETMCGIFTLIVSGLNPLANKNDEIHDVIKKISAEGIDPRNISLENIDLLNSIKKQEIPYDFCINEDANKPRIGKNYVSIEANNQEQNGDYLKILNDIKDIQRKLDKKKAVSEKTEKDESEIKDLEEKLNDLLEKKENSSRQVSKWQVDTKFSERLEKYPAYPTILKITFNIKSGGTVTVPVAVKANPIAIGSEEMKMFIESTLSGRSFKFIRYFKWKSGEISTQEYLLGTDIAKRDKKLYESLGRNPIYIEFMKRKAKSKFFGTIDAYNNKRDNVIGPTGSLIVTVDDLVAATNLDASRFTKNNDFIQRIMRETFIMCFAIADMNMEVVSFYFMGYKDPFRLNFAELGVGTNVSNDKQLESALLELSRKVA